MTTSPTPFSGFSFSIGCCGDTSPAPFRGSSFFGFLPTSFLRLALANHFLFLGLARHFGSSLPFLGFVPTTLLFLGLVPTTFPEKERCCRRTVVMHWIGVFSSLRFRALGLRFLSFFFCFGCGGLRSFLRVEFTTICFVGFFLSQIFLHV